MIHFNKLRKKKYWQALSVICLTTFALLVTGTFAWQSMNQFVGNEFAGATNPGARLHDDFNGTLNKDIYVENYTEVGEGVNVYARIMLKEYMEIGNDAGNVTSGTTRDTRDVTVIGKSDADITNPTTWHTHEFQPASTEDLAFREYWSWDMGNADTSVENYYMPTFNKDNESIEADVNGTLAGRDNDKNTGTPYDDYVEWKADMESELKSEILNGNVTSDPVKHTTKKIEEHASVISMQEWIAKGKPVGTFWVYDSDGWAYYAKAIEPSSASGLLLNKVSMVNTPEDKYYYQIRAIGQFATAGDWDGFEIEENGGITANGKELLNTVADRMPKVVFMAPVNGFEQMVTAGSSLSLDLNINVQNATGATSEKAVEWTINDEKLSHTIEGSRFTPTADMAGKVYVLTGKSKLTPTVTTTIRITVLPLGADDSNTIMGADGNPYVSFGFNIYKRVEKDGTLSNYICAGVDQKPGSDDDKTNVYELKDAHPTYGKFFLKKEENRYYWMEADKLLGTADDELLGSATNDWPNNITDRLVDRVKVMTIDGETENVQVKIGKTKQFKAEVYFANELISNQKVTWQISGNKSQNTTISENGLLTLGLDEPEGTYIRIIATSTEGKIKQANNILVMVSALSYEDIRDVEVQSTTTIKIGNNDYYVLENDGEKALLWAKQSVYSMYFGYGATSSFSEKGLSWNDSYPRYYLNSSFYNSIPSTIQDKILSTTIYYRYYTGTTSSTVAMGSTTDKIFLLSYEDLKGLNSNLSDERLYTGSGQLTKALTLPGDETWLRTNDTQVTTNLKYYAFYSSGGNSLSSASVGKSNGYRPAFWIKLPETASDTTTPDSTNP